VKILLDTNVLISGIFFTGPPYEILRAWRDGRLVLVVSLEILEEYKRVVDELASRYSGIDISNFFDILVANSLFVEAPPLPKPVCTDPYDDKFLACGVAGSAEYLVSGDKHLLILDRYAHLRIVSPKQFVDEILGQDAGS
jgi:putative PIN family toxin of toxin-antitoxin system